MWQISIRIEAIDRVSNQAEDQLEEIFAQFTPLQDNLEEKVFF